MKNDALKQFAKLRQQLVEEKSQIESKLNEINQALGTEAAPRQVIQSASNQQAPVEPIATRGRPKGSKALSMREAVLKALSNGPLARQELVGAVEDVGYVFTTKNPLNSIGSVLYGKNSPVKSKLGKFYLPGRAAVVTSDNEDGGGIEQAPAKKKRRKVSAEGRARISAARKAWWAKQKRGR